MLYFIANKYLPRNLLLFFFFGWEMASGVGIPGLMQTLGSHQHTMQLFKIMISSKNLNQNIQ